jgi:predicted nucleotidyltransferase
MANQPDELHHLPCPRRGCERADLREKSILEPGGRPNPNIDKAKLGLMIPGRTKGKPMKPSHAIQGKASLIKHLIESYGFASPAIFGSTARGTDVDGSDLDILATIPPNMRGKISLFDIQDLEADLEALTGVAVDFTVDNNMPDDWRASIERDVVML